MKENERLYQELLDKNHEIMNLTDKIDVLINDKNSLTYEVENFSKSASSL